METQTESRINAVIHNGWSVRWNEGLEDFVLEDAFGDVIVLAEDEGVLGLNEVAFRHNDEIAKLKGVIVDIFDLIEGFEEPVEDLCCDAEFTFADVEAAVYDSRSVILSTAKKIIEEAFGEL